MGVLTANIHDVLGCGETGILAKVRKYLGRRFRGVRAREQPAAHAGMGVSKANDFSAQATQKHFADVPKPVAVTTEFRASRQCPSR